VNLAVKSPSYLLAFYPYCPKYKTKHKSATKRLRKKNLKSIPSRISNSLQTYSRLTGKEKRSKQIVMSTSLFPVFPGVYIYMMAGNLLPLLTKERHGGVGR
jgi:hypothetical protein